MITSKPLLFFIPFTLLVLFIDSPAFAYHYFDGRLLTTFIAISYFLLLFMQADMQLRRLMLLTVVISYIGEVLLCNVLDMYDYRKGHVPLYVPFGHAIIYASGFLLSRTTFSVRHDRLFRNLFLSLFAGLFIGSWLLRNDVFTLITGTLFFLLLWRKRWQTLYLFIAAHALWTEVFGAALGCWVYSDRMYGLIPAANPPMGMVFFYLGGDIVIGKLAERWQSRKRTAAVAVTSINHDT